MRQDLIDFASFRKREFARLDSMKSVYLDYTGAALYPASLVQRDARRLKTQVLGNPHSESKPSLASTKAMEEARELTLRFLDADPADYEVVFTANATAAIRTVAEAFPFRAGSRLVLTADNHNSVNGLRVPALKRKARVEYVPLDSEMRSLDPLSWLIPATQPSLFAFPAQSNFSGVQHPLSWIKQAQVRGYRVLLDAAAYIASQPLSLRDVPADFVALSYYKMFGYPTGIGALVVRRESLSLLQRDYFAGGTVEFVSVQNGLLRRKVGGEGFEDGTPNFLAMPAVCDGLKWLRKIGMPVVRSNGDALISRLIVGLKSLGPDIEIYGPGNVKARGGTVAFNLRRAGRLVPFETVEIAARDCRIALRGGCFCNPGAAEEAFGINAERARACLKGGFTIPKFRACLQDSAVGAIRVSVGAATSTDDIESLFRFLSGPALGAVGHFAA